MVPEKCPSPIQRGENLNQKSWGCTWVCGLSGYVTWQWFSLTITSEAVFSTACGFNELHGPGKGSGIWAGVLL